MLQHFDQKSSSIQRDGHTLRMSEICASGIHLLAAMQHSTCNQFRARIAALPHKIAVAFSLRHGMSARSSPIIAPTLSAADEYETAIEEEVGK